MSVEARASDTTTCASETDDGDYETSSEGIIRDVQEKQVRDIHPTKSGRMDSECDDEAENFKGGNSSTDCCTQKNTFVANVLSKSMPVLKSTSSRENNEEDDKIPMSESSLARHKMMGKIETRIGSLLSSTSNVTRSTDTSRMDIIDESYEPKKQESRTTLPILQDTSTDLQSSPKDATSYELSEDRDLSQNSQESKESKNKGFLNKSNKRFNLASTTGTYGNDDLIGIAENPHPSIRSFYFPPIPEKDGSRVRARPQARIKKGMEAILKIDNELNPLQHKLNSITDEFRALVSQDHYSSQYTISPDISGCYLHRAEAFDHDSSIINNITRLIKQEQRADLRTDYYTPLYPMSKKSVPINQPLFSIKESVSRNIGVRNNDSFSLMMNSPGYSRSVGRDPSNVGNASNWHSNLIDKGNDYMSRKNSYVRFRDNRMEKDPSGSLITSISSSLYKCHRNVNTDYQKPHTSSYYDEHEPQQGGYNDNFIQRQARFVHGRAIHPRNTTTPLLVQNSFTKNMNRLLNFNDQPILSQAESWMECAVASCASEKMTRGAGSHASRESMGVVTSRKHVVATQDTSTITSTPEGFVISVNTSMHSQDLESLKRDQNVMTSSIEDETKEMDEDQLDQARKEFRDLDVQCSGTDLTMTRSTEILVKPSELMRNGSNRSSSKKSIDLAKTEEKVVIVPIFFTDGIPEPSKISLFNFGKSRRHAHRANHFVKLDKKLSSMSQNSVYSGHSVESSAIESSCLGQKLTNRNSGLSVSCVSRDGSSRRCRNPSHASNMTKTLSDYHHSRGRHSQSSKAHSESPMRRVKKKVIQGMMSSPEEFLSDT